MKALGYEVTNVCNLEAANDEIGSLLGTCVRYLNVTVCLGFRDFIGPITFAFALKIHNYIGRCVGLYIGLYIGRYVGRYIGRYVGLYMSNIISHYIVHYIGNIIGH